MRPETERWFGEAGEELAVSRAIQEREDLPARVACMHAHLAAEKVIKALLIERNVILRRSHDLFELVGLLPDEDAALIRDDDLELLNPWAIQGRYPADLGDIASQRVRAVVDAAAQILSTIAARLA